MVYSGVRPSIGQGVGTTVIPSNPDVLIDRLDLLMASNVAGNTGVRNELISICDELLRQNVIAKDLYKKNNYYIIKKMLIAKNRGYKRKYVYGGSGIFDSITAFLKGLLSTDASREISRQAASAALDVGKTAVTMVGKKLVDKAVNKLFLPEMDNLKRKANDVISKYINTGCGQRNPVAIQDLVRRMNGSGLKVV